jgi:lysophospholipase L1-like esterase
MGGAGAGAVGPVVFLGDSLTAGADWGSLFPRIHAINLGVSGHKTGDLLLRLDQVCQRQPGRIFIMAGINDLGAGVRLPDIVDNYRLIIEHLVRRLPSTRIYVQSVLPVNNNFYPGSIHNRKVRELNRRLEALASRLGLTYLNLFPHFIDEAGQLRSDFTRDGVHLNESGYKAWRVLLAGLLE